MIIKYQIVKDPEWGRMWLAGGVGYKSLKDLKKEFPGHKFVRVKGVPLYG